MCPSPGMILNITATASLALPSAVSVALRVQSHRSQLCASFGRRCPQYGQGILSSALGSGRLGGASVYSTFISDIEGSQAAWNSSSKLARNDGFVAVVCVNAVRRDVVRLTRFRDICLAPKTQHQSQAWGSAPGFKLPRNKR